MRRIFVLRKAKIFNKSRYSRNRQTTRVAFFLSIGINVLVVLGIFSLHYAYFLKLTTLWWLFYGFVASFVLGAFLRATAASSLRSNLTILRSIFVSAIQSACLFYKTKKKKLVYFKNFVVSSNRNNVHGYERMATIAAWSKTGWYAQDLFWRLNTRFSILERRRMFRFIYPFSRRTYLARWVFITYENAVPRDL